MHLHAILLLLSTRPVTENDGLFRGIARESSIEELSKESGNKEIMLFNDLTNVLTTSIMAYICFD